jgi:hypothetical protein
MPEIRNYAQANEYLLSGQNPARRTVEDNTCLVRMAFGEIVLYFYRTPIITYYQDGRITLFSGGFRTVTTKRRMNAYSPVVVFQRDLAWYVGHEDGRIEPFTERMNVGAPTPLPLHAMHNQALPL